MPTPVTRTNLSKFLNGTFLAPPALGCSAIIQTSAGEIIATSPVEHMIQNTDGRTCIITQHRTYHVKPSM